MSDTILGVFLIALAIFVLISSSSFPNLVVRGEKLPGPKYFPSLLSILMILLGVFYIVSSIFKLRKREKNQIDKSSKGQLSPLLVVLTSSILFVPVVQLVGTTVGVIAITFSMMVFFRVKWYYSAVISVTLALLIRLVFEVLFKVPLPEGTLIPL
ncbi:tripartite tricarboxylate transporter TctB family protein [Pseudothermotoga sp. U03pept]|uniref:tripartite tricarboxylate transporter TctB family protein n=1 Tax=Pseudothermotoga sp. U03pept TaxID=3447012 RepID=UPI0030ADEB9F